MPPGGGRKRAATSNGEGSSSTTPSHATKKTRFVEPEDDPVNFAEQVDSALEDTSRKRNIKNEGYESDSTDDGEGVVLSRKKTDGGGGDEDDMFALGDENEKKPDNDDGVKKKETYLRLGDIEGQEFGNDGSGSEGSEFEESDEPEDEDEAERRKKAGMGYELSSFNMREEMEEGKFTEDGSYVRTVDPHGVHDKWMDGVSEREMKQARKRKRQQEKIQQAKIAAEEKEFQESGGKTAVERKVLAMLKKGETVLEALQRLGSQEKKKQKGQKKAKSATAGGMQLDKAAKPPTDIEELTSLASTLMSLGDPDIYSKTYEEIVRAVRASGDVDQSWEPPSADVKYEYKWAAGTNTDVFGPFSEEEMKTWYKAAYFGPVGEKIQVRRLAGEWGNWDDVVQ
ncbi:hypothetical protein BDN72DRAFT_808618 [Pluteus cervinus]|uniref:Uncharacterized protein n=1 Tax=Pluteus cervinus TaxID=181527 RepID=A0ACD3BE20_9AGAR|nr:hypothetical protein BDN72DRAFT_808618 [Pluteus cervinus]